MSMAHIDFSLDLYSEEAIQEAIADYSDLASFETEHIDNCTQCTLLHSIYTVEETLHEFANYVLELTCQRGKTYDLA